MRSSNGGHLIFIAVCCFVWFGVSSWTQVQSKQALLESLPVVSLVFCQLFIGAVVNTTMQWCNRDDVVSDDARDDRHLMLLKIGLLNVVGHCCTMLSTQLIPTAITHAIKTSEAVFVATIGFMIGSLTLSRMQWCVVVVIILGIFLTSCQDDVFSSTGSGASVVGILVAMLSNCVMACRTLLTKSCDTQILYLDICYVGALVLFLPALLSGAPLQLYLSRSNLMASVGHVVYSQASFLVLKRVDSLSFTYLKICSRFLIVISTALAFGYVWTYTKIAGMAIVFGGLVVHSSMLKSGAGAGAGAGARVSLQNQNPSHPMKIVLCVSLCFSLVTVVQNGTAGPFEVSLPAFTASLASGRTAASNSQNYILVPFESYNECDLRVKRITCVTTAVLHDSVPLKLEVNHTLLSQMCNNLLISQKWTEDGAPLAHASVPLCVQHRGEVRAVVLTNDEGDYQSTPIAAIAMPEILSSLRGLDSNFLRMVSRSTILAHSIHLLPPEHKADLPQNEAPGKDNFGNLVWSWGASRLLNPYTTVVSADIKSPVTAYVIATANLLQVAEPPKEPAFLEMTQGLSNRIIAANVPVTILGIGIQLNFPTVNSDATLSEVDEKMWQTVDRAQLVPKQTRLVTAPTIRMLSVRGESTARVCRKHGAKYVQANGCPSLSINLDPNLGSILKQRWQDVEERLRSIPKELKVVITLPASNHDNSLLEILFTKIWPMHQCTVIMQTLRDRSLVDSMRRKFNLTIPENRVKFFYTFHEWRKEVETHDLVIGARIHGTMMGIAAGRPSFVFATDFRIQELANVMKLPTMSVSSLPPTASGWSLLEFVKDVNHNFDAAAFETNRLEKIKNYKSILNDLGLELNPKHEYLLSS